MRQLRGFQESADTRGAQVNYCGFVPYPQFLLGGLSPEQVAWQQSVYQRAYAEAARSFGNRVLRVSFGREARN